MLCLLCLLQAGTLRLGLASQSPSLEDLSTGEEWASLNKLSSLSVDPEAVPLSEEVIFVQKLKELFKEGIFLGEAGTLTEMLDSLVTLSSSHLLLQQQVITLNKEKRKLKAQEAKLRQLKMDDPIAASDFQNQLANLIGRRGERLRVIHDISNPISLVVPEDFTFDSSFSKAEDEKK